MCFEYDGYNDFESRYWLKARKDHKCYECCRVIVKGEKYQKFSGKYDGEFFEFKTCAACESLREHITKEEEAEGCHPSESVCPVGILMEEARERGLFPTVRANSKLFGS